MNRNYHKLKPEFVEKSIDFNLKRNLLDVLLSKAEVADESADY